jgi:glycosyltransferase involved in cell wall biosynthesis
MVSVIIPTYNRAQSIASAVASVLSQTYRHMELIVVDDGSTDNTRQALEPFKDRLQYIYQNNAGPASARNRGIRIASGEWLAFLDSDDTWYPRKLEIQLAESIRMNADLSFHDLSLNSDENSINIPSWNLHVTQSSAGHAALGSGVLLDAYGLMMMIGHFFLTTTFMVKRDAILAVGGFREDLRTSEDLELYFRLAARYIVAYVAETLATYSPGPGGLRNSEVIYRDRIKAIKIAMSDRLEHKDYKRAWLCKIGLLQQVRSLASAYRHSGAWLAALATYLRYGTIYLMPIQYNA